MRSFDIFEDLDVFDIRQRDDIRFREDFDGCVIR